MSKKVLYVMQNSLGPVKIGVSNDPDRRVKEVRLASGFKTEVLKTFDTKLCALEVEKKVHKHFQPLRLEGEWFKKEVLETLDETVHKIENPVSEYIYGSMWSDGRVYRVNKDTLVVVDAPHLSTYALDLYDTREEAIEGLIENLENFIKESNEKIEKLRAELV